MRGAARFGGSWPATPLADDMRGVAVLDPGDDRPDPPQRLDALPQGARQSRYVDVARDRPLGYQFVRDDDFEAMHFKSPGLFQFV